MFSPRFARRPGPVPAYSAALLGSVISISSAVVAHYVGVEGSASFIAGLVGVSLSLQLELLIRGVSLRHDLADVGEVADIMLRNTGYTQRLLSILRALDRLCNDERAQHNAVTGNIFPERADEVMSKCQNDLAVLVGGSFTTTVYDFSPIKEALNRTRCGDHFRAVAVQGVDRLTYRTVGDDTYFNSQREAVGRGVTIERVFMYSRRDSNVVSTMRRQDAAGVKVYELPISDAPEHLRVDCAIVEDKFYGRIEPGAAGGVRGMYYSRNQTELDTRTREFEELKTIAYPFHAEAS